MPDHHMVHTLGDVREAITVPPIDHTAFRSRTRRLRRRRVTMLSTAAGAALVGTVSAGLVLSGAQHARVTQAAAAAEVSAVPVVLSGRIQLLGADGELTDLERSGSVVGMLGDEVVSLFDDVLVVPGRANVPDVVGAFTSPAGVTYQSTDGTVIQPDGTAEQVAGDLVAAGDGVLVVQRQGRLVVRDRTGERPLRLGSDGSSAAVLGVGIADNTVEVSLDGTANFYDIGGDRLDGELGGVTGALSPDGEAWAYAPNDAELRSGMTSGFVLSGITSGTLDRVELEEPALDVAWHGDTVTVLTELGEIRTVWSCSAGGCDPLLSDTSGTLSLR